MNCTPVDYFKVSPGPMDGRGYPAGTKVRVEFDGVVAPSGADDSSRVVVKSDQTGYSHRVCFLGGDMRVTEKAPPPFWPPQAGDIWRHADGKDHYFVTKGAGSPRFHRGDGTSYAVDSPARAPAKWTLVYRQGVDAGVAG